MPHVLQNKQSWMPTDGAFCHTRPAFHVISRDWQDVNEKYERRVFSNPLSIFVRLLCFWHGVHAAIKKLAAVGDFPLAVAHVSLFSTPVCSWRCIWRVETVLCLCISHWQLNCHPILFHAMLSSAISSHVPLIFGPGHTAICSVKKTGTLWFGIAPALYPAQVLLSEIMMRVGKVLQIIYSTSLNPKTSSARFCRNCCRILWCPKQTKKLRINLHETCYETRPRLSGTIKPLSSQLTPAAKTWHDSFEKLLKRDFRSEKKMRLESPGVVCTLIFTWFARVRHDSEDLQILNSLNSRFDPARSVLQAGEKRNRSSKNWHIWHMNLSLIHHHTWQWRLTIEAGVTSTKKLQNHYLAFRLTPGSLYFPRLTTIRTEIQRCWCQGWQPIESSTWAPPPAARRAHHGRGRSPNLPVMTMEYEAKYWLTKPWEMLRSSCFQSQEVILRVLTSSRSVKTNVLITNNKKPYKFGLTMTQRFLCFPQLADFGRSQC